MILASAAFVYIVFEHKMYLVHKKTIAKCHNRLKDSHQSYIVPNDVSEDVLKQITTMPRVKTFIQDLFGCTHHTDIKYGNLENLFRYTVGVAQPMIDYAVSILEKEFCHKFEEGFNDGLNHTYCREDNVIRSIYVPFVLTGPILSLKYICDYYVSLDYVRFDTPHIVYWVKHTSRSSTDRPPNPSASDSKKSIMVMMCGIGVGPITYHKFMRFFEDAYDLIIMCEIKWISFHLSADPAQDSAIIDALAACLNDGVVSIPGSRPGLSPHSSAAQELLAIRRSNSSHMDVMMHSGGALYFRRIIEKVNFRKKFLIEPACFLSGSSTATLQIFTYKTLNPLFQYPLIKNLPKLLDITECVLQTKTPMENTYVILSERDSLFDPLPCLKFMQLHHPAVKVYVLPNSNHGLAVGVYAKQTSDIVLANC